MYKRQRSSCLICEKQLLLELNNGSRWFLFEILTDEGDLASPGKRCLKTNQVLTAALCPFLSIVIYLFEYQSTLYVIEEHVHLIPLFFLSSFTSTFL